MTKLYYYKSLNWRRPLTEDDLKIFKVEYLCNHLLDHTQISNLGLDDQTLFYKSLKGRRPQNIKSRVSPQPFIGSSSNFKLRFWWLNHILQIRKRKMTSNGRGPLNIKSGLSLQPFIGSNSNSKLRLRWPNRILQSLKRKMTTNGRRPQNIKPYFTNP